MQSIVISAVRCINLKQKSVVLFMVVAMARQQKKVPSLQKKRKGNYLVCVKHMSSAIRGQQA